MLCTADGDADVGVAEGLVDALGQGARRGRQKPQPTLTFSVSVCGSPALRTYRMQQAECFLMDTEVGQVTSDPRPQFLRAISTESLPLLKRKD